MTINSDLILKESILIRETEKTLLDLFSKGKLNGTVHTCIGQEYIGALL
jgi:2-oxoisovalerate dehydrogenase E1 component